MQMYMVRWQSEMRTASSMPAHLSWCAHASALKHHASFDALVFTQRTYHDPPLVCPLWLWPPLEF